MKKWKEVKATKILRDRKLEVEHHKSKSNK